MASATGGNKSFDGERLRQELNDKGYVVVPDLFTPTESDRLALQFKDWVTKFDKGQIPLKKRRSVIQTYRVGHFEASWEARLRAKSVFQAVWGTEKLLSSVDGIAIAKPPQNDDDFHDVDADWLHLDQGVCREGLHAYQAAVSGGADRGRLLLPSVVKVPPLPFRILPNLSERREKTKRLVFYKMFKKQKEFFYNKGWKLESVPVPMGGIVLWDSRTAHDNSPPIVTRANPDRWRFVVFVSMTPAIWANEKDIAFRKDAYQRMLLTTHWSSQGLKTFPEYKGNKRKRNPVNVSIDVLPEVARTQEARLLAGDKRYDFEDGKPNGPAAPKWRFGGYENFGTG